MYPYGRVFAAALAMAMASGAAAPGLADDDDDDDRPPTLAEQLRQDLRGGLLTLDGDHAAVQELILNRNIPIPYSYIQTLMYTPNAFGEGAACVVCHASSDPIASYRGLDLSSCEGMLQGSTETPARAIFTAGQDPRRDILGRRLRNNRMPLGVQFNIPTDAPAYLAVRDWIIDGAENDAHFEQDILPLFSTDNVFAPDTPACTACHMSNEEPPSFHELDLTSYAGIMLGADSIARGVENATKVIIPGDPDASGVWQHLAEDRMPPGISPAEDRDHPNTHILFLWVKQGAKCG